MSTLDEIKKVLRYEPDTGFFYWLVNRQGKVKAGDVAGCLNRKDGYIRIRVFNKFYSAHRLAWLYTHGYLPKVIDHKDRNRSNNAISNLREATQSQNCMNKGRLPLNTSGFRGVTWNKKVGKWQAQASLNLKTIYLGIFDSPEVASEAYQRFCAEQHGEFYAPLGGSKFIAGVGVQP